MELLDVAEVIWSDVTPAHDQFTQNVILTAHSAGLNSSARWLSDFINPLIGLLLKNLQD
jgi:predicted alpha/beta hydrolase family esterase